jgi:hypothetical protein
MGKKWGMVGDGVRGTVFRVQCAFQSTEIFAFLDVKWL